MAVIDAANRAYLAAYRRNAKLMALMEQVAQIDSDFRRTPAAPGPRVRRAQRAGDLEAAATGLADRELDPQLAADALSGMVSRMAYLRYVLGFGTASPETLARTLTRLWVNALGITKEMD